MNTNDTRQNAHKLIDRVFLHLLPALGMAERPEQVRLSHLMLDALLGGSIALCDAGTGIGKTYAYLAAGTALLLSRAAAGKPFQPILISTSSIALQNAVQNEYLPILSAALLADGIIDQPMRSVIRKGKSHYVCPKRLERRLGQLNLSKKNWRAGAALLSLRGQLDMDGTAHLSSYDRARVCVSKDCDCAHCDREQCSYLGFLEDCEGGNFQFQICNHNLLLADAIHRGTGRKAILPDACAVVIDEAHKLPETARQMFGTTLEAGNIRNLIDSLRRERFLLAAESLAELSSPLLRLMAQPFDGERYYNNFARLLLAPARNLHIIQKQLQGKLSASTYRQLKKLASTMELLTQENPDLVFYVMEDEHGGSMLCTVAADMTAQLRSTLWNQDRPAILTSATLAVGTDFRRFKEETGLLTNRRIMESVSPSPFDYKSNCLLYLPLRPPEQADSSYFDVLAAEIAALVDASWGHALVLFTSYAAMSAVKERLTDMALPQTLFTLGRNAVHTTQQFKASPGSVLLATGAAWEGFDFPGDCVSMLVIPRLPFSHPDALKEKKRAEYPDLRSFIRAVAVPEMQIKLKQGFGRAIRTETDTCVIAILDERAAPGQRHYVNANHHYARTRERNAKKWNSMSEEERESAKIMQKKLQAILLSTPSREPMDPNYRRILYARYADDFLIGVIGSRADAEQVKTAVSDFLKQELNLTMSPEKTLITHGHDKARFLGYDITISKNQVAKKTKGGIKRAYNGRVVLLLPKEKWKGKLQEYGALHIQKDGTGKEIWMPVARNGLQNKEPIEILAQFNGEIRGIYNYYRLARNVSVLNKFHYVMEYSMYKTIARKMRCSAAKVKKKYTRDRVFGIEYETKHGTKRAGFYHDGFRKNVPSKLDMDTMPDYRYPIRPKEVIARFMTGYCELCCKNELPVMIYQVKSLKSLAGNETWEQFMLKKRRKTLIVCEDCYKTITNS